MLKVGDKVYEINDFGGTQFEVEVAIVDKITPKLIHLREESGRGYPGLSFKCTRQWPIDTKFCLTPYEACNKWIKNEQERVHDLHKEIVSTEASITKMFNFRAGFKK